VEHSKSPFEEWQERIKCVDRNCIQCDFCGETDPREMCTSCNSVYYCNNQCRSEHWIQHTDDCKVIQDKALQIATLEAVTDRPLREAKNSTCGICQRWPMNHPSMLKCKHAYCGLCLEGWKIYNRHNYPLPSVEGYGCPLCKVPPATDELKVWDHKTKLLIARAYVAHKSGEKENNALKEEVKKYLNQAFSGKKADILCYFRKAELMLALGAAKKAIESIDEMIKVDKERRVSAAPLEQISHRLLTASIDCNATEVATLEQTLVELFEERKDSLGTYLKGGKTRYWKPIILKAQAYEILREWDSAALTYMDIIEEIKGDEDCALTMQHDVLLGMARCFYGEQMYEMSIGSARMSIGLDRHYPGGYKSTAYALRALGNLRGAILTIQLAVFYETPWDIENRLNVLRIYEKFCSEQQQQKEKQKEKQSRSSEGRSTGTKRRIELAKGCVRALF